MIRTVAIIPAKNRADTVGATVVSISSIAGVSDVIVVDDGSSDATADAARAAGATVVVLEENRGKGGAVAAGVAASGAAARYLLVDADTAESAAGAAALLERLDEGDAAMVIGVLPPAGRDGGLGLVRRMAERILRRFAGFEARAPLSGQRAIEGALLRSLDLAPRFGLEVGLTLDVCARGEVVVEVDVDMSHRATGRSAGGFAHRARQGWDLLSASAHRVGWAATLRAAAGFVGPSH